MIQLFAIIGTKVKGEVLGAGVPVPVLVGVAVLPMVSMLVEVGTWVAVDVGVFVGVGVPICFGREGLNSVVNMGGGVFDALFIAWAV
jgi:hypothetical protein